MLFSLFSFLATPAFADAPANVAAPATARGLTETEDMAVSHALAEAKAKADAAKKTAAKAKAKAVASGDTATVAKCDEVLAKLAVLDTELDGLAKREDVAGLSAKVIDLGANLDGINGQLTALTAAIDALPTNEEVRTIVREELDAARQGYVDELAKVVTTTTTTTVTNGSSGVSTTPPAATPPSNIGWMVGVGVSIEGRAAYSDIVAPVGGGVHALAGLTWGEDDVGLGTAVLAYGGCTTGNGAQLGSDLVVYRDGHLDLGFGLGVEERAFDVWGESMPAANAVSGVASGYFRVGSKFSFVAQPYMRLGAFTAGQDGGVATGYGLRLTGTFGSP